MVSKMWRPIEEAILEAQRGISDAEWDGDTELAQRLSAALSSLLIAQEVGEKFETDF